MESEILNLVEHVHCTRTEVDVARSGHSDVISHRYHHNITQLMPLPLPVDEAHCINTGDTIATTTVQPLC
jgi:hypothetical protein